MVELKLDIVFKNLDKLLDNAEKRVKGMFEGSGSKSGGKSEGGSSGKGTSFLLGGILGFVAGLASSVDAVMKVLQIIGAAINMLVLPFVPFLLTLLKPVMALFQIVLGYMLSYFKDPVRTLLKIGVFIVNGIIAGLEAFANLLLPGSPVELPRLQESLVMLAYDNFQETVTEAAEDGIVTFKEASEAYMKFGTGLINSFITNSKYAEIVDLGFTTGLNAIDTMTAILYTGAKNTSDNLKAVFENGYNFLKDASDKIDEYRKELGLKSNRRTGTSVVRPDLTSENPTVTDFKNLIGQTQKTQNNTININVGSVTDTDAIKKFSEMVGNDITRKFTMIGAFN